MKKTICCVALLFMVFGCKQDDPNEHLTSDNQEHDAQQDKNVASGGNQPETPMDDIVPEKTLTNSIGMKLVYIEPGTFQMGCDQGDFGVAFDEEPVRQVHITKGFYMGVTEVTQDQWRKAMGTIPYLVELEQQYIRYAPNYPAVYVTWKDAVEFCERLNTLEKGSAYRLPTEAQWEYACRAGTTTWYSFGDDEKDMGKHAWYIDNTWAISEKYAHEVGLKVPNPWGLYDMHGNVWEWCRDWYDEDYYSKRPDSDIDPENITEMKERVFRGGSWRISPDSCSSTSRSGTTPSNRSVYLGFRVVLDLE